MFSRWFLTVAAVNYAEVTSTFTTAGERSQQLDQELLACIQWPCRRRASPWKKRPERRPAGSPEILWVDSCDRIMYRGKFLSSPAKWRLVQAIKLYRIFLDRPSMIPCFIIAMWKEVG